MSDKFGKDNEATEYYKGEDLEATEYYKGEDSETTEYYKGEDRELTEYYRGEDSEVTEYVKPAAQKEPVPVMMPEKKGFHRCLHCFEELDGSRIICPNCGYEQNAGPAVNFHLAPGTVLKERYIIGDVEGFGGFGITYRAWDLMLDRMVAIKEYFNTTLLHRIPGSVQTEINGKNKAAQLEEELRRFKQEAEYTAEFRDCRGIVEIFNIFSENGTSYIVMEFLHGLTLQHYVAKKGGRLNWAEAQRIFADLSEAVEKLHDRKILHRDISPDNIFICKDGTVKLMDLGAARFSDGSENKHKTVVLKPGFAPPEQYLDNGNQGEWTDVYAMSASLYWALTGKKPPESTNRQDKDTLKKPSELVAELPAYVDRVLLRGMNLTPELRFRNMREFRKALLHGEGVLDPAGELRKRRIRRSVFITAAFAVLLGVSFFLYRWYGDQKEQVELAAVELLVWVTEDSDTEEKLSVYRSMTEEFTKDYPHVKVSFEPVSREQYEKMVLDADTGGDKRPALFCTDETAGYSTGTDISEVYSYMEEGSLSPAPDKTVKDRIPLGFRSTCAFGSRTVKGNTSCTTDPEEFIAGNALLFIGEVSDYYLLQDRMPGVYEVLSLPEGSRASAFTDYWTVNSGISKDEINAAVRLLSYWLGENAQEALHVKQRGNLPVNRNELSVLMEINSELSDKGIEDSAENRVAEEEFNLQAAKLASDESVCSVLREQIRNVSE